jgi:hypothetical protein
MPNDFYNVTGAPSQGSFGASATLRAEFAAIAAGMDKLPALSGNALELVRVNTGATGLEAVPASTVLSAYLPLAGGTMAGPLLLADGLETAPGLAFGTDANTGIYRVAENQLGISAGGGRTVLVTTDGLQLKLGTSSLPSYSFTGDSNTGMYSDGADTIAWAVNAGQRMILNGSSLTLLGGSAQAFRIHDNQGYAAFWNSAGTTRTGYLQMDTTNGAFLTVELNLPMRFYTNTIERMQITGSGDFGFNCSPVSSILARFEDDGFDDAGLEFARTAANAVIIQSYNRTGSAYGTLSLDGSTVVVNSSGSQRYSFGPNSISPAATNTYNLGGSGADWQTLYVRSVFRDTAGTLTIAATDAAGTMDFRVAGASALAIDSNRKSTFSGGVFTTTSSQAFTATPTFNANLSNVFEFSGALTANVTSCTISNPSNGQTIQIRVKQDATGGRTFAAPSGAKITGSIGATASAASILTLTYSAMDARWEGSWLNLPV